MSSLREIRKRIGSVKNTQKITRAMKLVAAARLRRAQESIIAARPYSETLERVMADLAKAVDSEAHPLLEAREKVRHAQVIVMTSDRGLAGSFNAALLRQADNFINKDLADIDTVEVRVIGRKGNDYFRRRDFNIGSFELAPTGDTAADFSRAMANSVIDDFTSGKTDAVYLAFNHFRAPGSQVVTTKKLLPLDDIGGGETDDEPAPVAADFIYEPSEEELLDHLLPLYVQVGLFRAALESIASELGSRMAAMDAATRNAGEMIAKLTLQYNRARQAAITKELLEIIAGAEALNG